MLWRKLPHHCPRLVLRAAGWAPAKGSRALGSPPRQTSSGALRCFRETRVLFWAMLASCQVLRAGPFSQTNRVIVICPCAPPSSVNAFASLNICSCWPCLLESTLTDLKVARDAEPIQNEEAALMASCRPCSRRKVFSVRLHIAAARSCRDL